MKIPTQQNNVKKTALVVAGMAVVTGLAVPTATFAQGQSGSGLSDRNSTWNRGNHGGGYGGHWDRGSWLSWDRISAEDFSKWNESKLQRIDSYVQKNNLEIENGEALRAAVDSNAAVVVDNLTTLEQLRDSTGSIESATDEERAALKEQSIMTFSAYYDYKLSLYDYTAAIKAIATNDGVKLDAAVEEEAPAQ